MHEYCSPKPGEKRIYITLKCNKNHRDLCKIKESMVLKYLIDHGVT